MMKLSDISYYVLALSGAALVFWLVVTVMAMAFGEGRALIDFNRHHEEWLEVALLTVTILLYPWAWYKGLRNKKSSQSRIWRE